MRLTLELIAWWAGRIPVLVWFDRRHRKQQARVYFGRLTGGAARSGPHRGE